MTAISLVISDVDGTLVTPDKEITPASVQAACRLADAGIAFTVVSSRPPAGLRMLVEPLSLRLPMGAFSGGAIDDNGGGNSMAFYNVQKGDAPVLKRLADQFSMSDNFHQSVMGGTGANHVMLGTGDAIFWSDGHGNATTPPSHIANPDPLPGSNNQYTVDINFDGNFT